MARALRTRARVDIVIIPPSDGLRGACPSKGPYRHFDEIWDRMPDFHPLDLTDGRARPRHRPRRARPTAPRTPRAPLPTRGLPWSDERLREAARGVVVRVRGVVVDQQVTLGHVQPDRLGLEHPGLEDEPTQTALERDLLELAQHDPGQAFAAVLGHDVHALELADALAEGRDRVTQSTARDGLPLVAHQDGSLERTGRDLVVDVFLAVTLEQLGLLGADERLQLLVLPVHAFDRDVHECSLQSADERLQHRREESQPVGATAWALRPVGPETGLDRVLGVRHEADNV